MEIDKIVIKRNNSYWPHDNDSIDIFVGKIWIKIDIPYGHTSDEIFIDYSFGNGYEGLDQDKDNYEIEVPKELDNDELEESFIETKYEESDSLKNAITFEKIKRGI